MKLIDKIDSPSKLKKLNLNDKKILAEEIREYIIDIVSTNGGHLASNLGIVELTIALHSVFNAPVDKIVFDVGHQCYVHKILTGRKDALKTLRKFNGISGFPKTSESIYDVFNTGHSSTSISAAAGIARSRDIQNKNYNVVAIIGDGSLTGGMALEALNDVGSSNLNMTVILNDNEMSISKNVGGIPLLLSKMRTRKLYSDSNSYIKKVTLKIPFIGQRLVNLVQSIKRMLKQVFIKNMYFEDIGFTYLGPVDGHNIEQLEDIFKRSKRIRGPVLIHVITKKGKGYKYAEENPSKFHGISSFNKDTGLKLASKSVDYSKVFGDKLVSLARKNKNIVAVVAAMKDGTGLSNFADEFKDRFFDVGIAEEHALGLVAGMAKSGLKPFIPIYSSFLQRGYDQLIHDIALQDLGVVICIDRAGIVGNDGETHQGIFDLSYLRTIPNITIMSPKDFFDLSIMMDFAVYYDHPIAIRYPRGSEGEYKFKKHDKIKLGVPEVLKSDGDIAILAIGKMVEYAYLVSNELSIMNINAKVVNMRFLKPINEKKLKEIVTGCSMIVTIEDNLITGLYDTILEFISKYNLNIKTIPFGYKDKFVKQGTVSEIEKDNGLNKESIVKKIVQELDK